MGRTAILHTGAELALGTAVSQVGIQRFIIGGKYYSGSNCIE
jgi:hypothetical protein